MEPQRTAVQPPIHLRIADDIRLQIERGDLSPGAAIPTLAELTQLYDTSTNSARGAIALLRSQGLITSGRGKPPVVRVRPRRAVRSSERHQVEKDLARRPASERATLGEAETNFGMSIEEQRFETTYDIVLAPEDLAEAIGIEAGRELLQRRYESFEPAGGRLLTSSVSYIPKSLVESNPSLLDADNEPWPGGTMHQLSTVGIEIMSVVDEVTARMPTTFEAQRWELPQGVPLIFCRRICYDATGRVIEISDAYYPADRTALKFVTPLRPWSE